MDARSLFAVLAVAFIFWLVRAWAQWDSRERMARESRSRLRNRLETSTFKARVVAGDSTRVTAEAIEPVERESTNVTQDSVSTLVRLRKQLDLAEARARSAEQNDLELRRLRSELTSIKAEKTNAAKHILVLEKRLREQQEVLNKSAPIASKKKKVSRVPAKQVIAPLFAAPEERDDLKKIRGIGPVMENTLNQLGVKTYSQLARFTQNDIMKVTEVLGAFPGRIERDDWIGTARKLQQESNSV